MRKKEMIQMLKSSFPKTDFSFAYGSAVFVQPKTLPYSNLAKESKPKMMDFIFSVNNPLQWHQLNFGLNPEHYRHSLRSFKCIRQWAHSFAPAIVFFPYAKITGSDMFLKYGVISTERLIDDLRTWRSLYVAGRLHKPVSMAQMHILIFCNTFIFAMLAVSFVN